MKIKAILLDFGGVIAEEGFQEGLYAITRSAFFRWRMRLFTILDM
jgi:hypothetical protein